MSIISDLKNLYYSTNRTGFLPHPAPALVDSIGSGKFVNATFAVIDGQSNLLREPNPRFGPLNAKTRERLYWRTVLFNDELAFWILKENLRMFWR